MKHNYNVEILKINTVHELEDAWSLTDYKAMLDLCDFEGIDDLADAELFDYLAMALQENDPEDAAAIVLEHRLGDRLKKGQIQSVAQDMLEENLWEEYGDMSLHEELFNITALLYKAFNGKFPHPDAVEMSVKISSTTGEGKRSLLSFDESLISRVLALGQDDHAIINRLFDERIAGPVFPEAKDIIWKYELQERDDSSVVLSITTALYWVKNLRKGLSYEAHTQNDNR